jgi:hypothetical protein
MTKNEKKIVESIGKLIKGRAEFALKQGSNFKLKKSERTTSKAVAKELLDINLTIKVLFKTLHK